MFKPKVHYILIFTLILFAFLTFYLNHTLRQNNINLKDLNQDINNSAEIIEKTTEDLPQLENQINDLVYRGEKVNIINPVYKGQKVNITKLK